MSEPRLHVSDDPAAAVADLLAAEARRGGTICLTGGSAPGRAYELAATQEPDWGTISVYWGDERCVPPDDDRSNYGLARRTLLDRLSVLPTVHRMQGELPPAEGAAEYDRELQGVTIDLLLLGLGPDGHIASLFPGSPQLAERERLAVSGPAGLEPFVERITLTLPALLAARRTIVLTPGESKAAAVAAAFRGPVDEAVPASLLRTGRSPLDVYLDAAASG
jgi:6-phosphogluconolactonase